VPRKKTRKRRNARPKSVQPVIDRLLVDRDEAAAMLGISSLTLSLWSQQGILRPLDLPASRRRRAGDQRLRRCLYSKADLEKFINTARARG
jgi:predicted site-specific integrase-resolvase